MMRRRVINNNGRNGCDMMLNSYRQGVEEGWTKCGGNSLGDTGLVDSNSTAHSASTWAVHERQALASSVLIKNQLSALNKNGQWQLNGKELISLLTGGIGLSTLETRGLRMPQHEHAVTAVKRMCSSDRRNIVSNEKGDVGQDEIIAEALPPPEPPPASNIPAEPPPYAKGKFVVINRIGDSNCNVDGNMTLSDNTFAIASYGSGNDDGTDGCNTSSEECKYLPQLEARPLPNITQGTTLIYIIYDDIQNLHLYSSDTASIDTHIQQLPRNGVLHIRQLPRNGVLSMRRLSRMGNRQWSIGGVFSCVVTFPV